VLRLIGRFTVEKHNVPVYPYALSSPGNVPRRRVMTPLVPIIIPWSILFCTTMFHTDKLTAQFLLTCHIRYRTLICNINKNYNSDFIIFFYYINLRFHYIVTSSARSSNVCKLHFLSHVIEYIIYRFIFLSLTVALFDTRCSIVYKFTFLSRTTDSFNILRFCRTMLKF